MATFLDELKYAAAEIADSATNTASSARIQLQMRDLERKRETLCALIGAGVLDRVRADPSLKMEFLSTIEAIDAIDSEYQSLKAQLDAVKATKNPYAAAGLTCPSCGQAVSSNDCFCMRCGAKLR